jgi:hypothetical protein
METKERAYEMPEMQRLLCTWTMDLAAFLRSKYNMDKKRALELAHLNRELLTHLGSGRVCFVYKKMDGTIREACGTLCKGISEDFDAYKCKGTPAPKQADKWLTECFVYWDLEEGGFRTFKASRLIKIKAATIVNCQHAK